MYFSIYKKHFFSFSYVLILSTLINVPAFALENKKKVSVDTIIVQTKPLMLYDEVSGRTFAHRKVDVRSQVDGIIMKRYFEEGSVVHKGDILYQIDPASYEAELKRYDGRLASYKEDARVYKLITERNKELYEATAISEEEYEESMRMYRTSVAGIKEYSGLVQGTKVKLTHTKITAPISGIIGKSYYSVGALVSTPQADQLATIQQIESLYIDLSVSSRRAMKFKQMIQKGQKGVDKISLSFDDGEPIESEAQFQFLDISVNESTDTVILRATIDNSDEKLLPGLYLNAKLPVQYISNAILIDQSAVGRDGLGVAHVKVVNQYNVVEDRVCVIGRAVGNQWLITDGLKSGDQVIVSGLQKVSIGSQVVVNQTNK